MKANSKLPKGNQFTTPERAGEREKERMRKAIAGDPVALFGANLRELRQGQTRLRILMLEDAEQTARIVAAWKARAEAGSFKHIELFAAYMAGKPIAMVESGTVELSGDDLFDTVESVRERLTHDAFEIVGANDDTIS